jgi:O-antigen/teichoic acid export membrane protein
MLRLTGSGDSGAVARLKRLVRRLGWGVADQVLSSFTNFAVGLLIVRMFGIAAFGGFAIAFTTYTVALNISRGLATDPLVVRYSGSTGPTWERVVRESTGTALVVGFLTGVVCVVAGFLVGDALGPGVGHAVVGVGVALPGLLLQDAWRYAFFASGRGGHAFLSDLVWAAAQLVAFAAIAWFDVASIAVLVLGWGGAASVAALVGVAQAGLVPRPARALRWIRGNRDLGTRYLAENLVISGGTQLRTFGVGAVAGLSSVGALRANELLLGPVNIIQYGLEIVVLPDAVRAVRESVRRFVRICVLFGVALTVLTLLWGGALLLLPDQVGELILGPSWWEASPLLLPMVLWTASSALTNGANVGLRALAAARRSVNTRVVTASLMLGSCLGGAALAGASGAAWGLAMSGAVSAAVWWWQFSRGLRERSAGGTSGGAPER